MSRSIHNLLEINLCEYVWEGNSDALSAYQIIFTANMNYNKSSLVTSKFITNRFGFQWAITGLLAENGLSEAALLHHLTCSKDSTSIPIIFGSPEHEKSRIVDTKIFFFLLYLISSTPLWKLGSNVNIRNELNWFLIIFSNAFNFASVSKKLCLALVQILFVCIIQL